MDWKIKEKRNKFKKRSNKKNAATNGPDSAFCQPVMSKPALIFHLNHRAPTTNKKKIKRNKTKNKKKKETKGEYIKEGTKYLMT